MTLTFNPLTPKSIGDNLHVPSSNPKSKQNWRRSCQTIYIHNVPTIAKQYATFSKDRRKSRIKTTWDFNNSAIIICVFKFKTKLITVSSYLFSFSIASICAACLRHSTLSLPISLFCFDSMVSISEVVRPDINTRKWSMTQTLNTVKYQGSP